MHVKVQYMSEFAYKQTNKQKTYEGIRKPYT